MPAYTTNKATRLAQLDKEILDRLKEVQTLIKPGDDRSLYYLSNLRTGNNANDVVAVAVGNPAIIAAFLVMHSESNPHILDALPIAKEVIANARKR